MGSIPERGNNLIVIFHTGIEIAVIHRLDRMDKGLTAIVDRIQFSVFLNPVDCSDHIIIQRTVNHGIDILFNSEADGDSVRILFLKATDLRTIVQCPLHRHAALMLGQMRMPGEADLRAAQADCLQNQFLRGVRTVAVRGMRMVVGKSHAIFSCLTLWSITWREASSARISSGRMPISTIMTMTW